MPPPRGQLASTPDLPHSSGLSFAMPGLLLVFLLALLLPPAHRLPAAEVPSARTLLEVRALSPEEADQKILVRITGTITFIDRKSNSVFLQDQTAGTYFRPSEVGRLQPGDEVEVVGRTQSGYYVPGLARASFQLLRRGALPPAIPARYLDLISARYHYQWVAVEGIARAFTRLEGGRSLLRLALDGHPIEIRCDAEMLPASLPLGSLVRVTGLCSGTINAQRQLVLPYLRIPHWDAVTLLQAASDESDLPRTSAADLLTFRVSGFNLGRVRVGGVVTAVFPGHLAFARDEKTGVGIQFIAPTALAVGDQIEALGFPQVERLSALLADAVLVSRRPGPPPAPLSIPLEKLLGVSADSNLVTVTGSVTDSYRLGTDTVLTLQEHGQAVRVRLPPGTATPPLGATATVTGICQIESTRERGYLQVPELLLLRARDANDLHVLATPSWWTTQRLLYLLVALGALMGLALLWIALLRHQVSTQTAALARRIEAEAILEERQRLARDFHDTLEQDLAGLNLQLDAVAPDQLPAQQQGLIAASQNLVKRIQRETRTLISDLRETHSVPTDLLSALRACLARHTCPPDVSLRLESTSAPPTLPAPTLRQLTLIVGEGIANALKHARPRTIVVTQTTTASVLLLAVTDDGCGFDAAVHTRGRLGHFGCIGIRERCRKIGAQPTWTSTPGQGTRLQIALPLPSPAGTAGGATATSTASEPPRA